MKRLPMCFLAIAIAFLIAVGLSVIAYGHKEFRQEGSPLSGASDFVIQIDDFGSFWDASVPESALSAIERSIKSTNTIVVLFVHGWHHNAAPGDDNVIDFADSLSKVRDLLVDNPGGVPGPYRRSRELLTTKPDVNIIGIYIGWRGKSLPMPLDYLTFWGRKAAAERVGQGDLAEFLARLHAIYLRSYARRKVSHNKPFMGMVTFGHSFGGQVLFRSVSQALEQQFVAASSSGDRKNGLPIVGLGDLVVLVNPALEAFQFERLHRLSRELTFDRRQTPVLLVLSAETDLARKALFPIGRWIDSLFRAPFREGQAQLWKTALGEYERQQTHLVDIDAASAEDAGRVAQFDPMDYVRDPCKIINYDLADAPAIAGLRFTPTKNNRPFNPLLVAYTSGDVIIRHSGIFEKTLRKFLNDYVAIVEGKRLLLSDARRAESCPRGN